MRVKIPHRPLIQSAFLDWYAEAESRFAIPVRITRKTSRALYMRFVGITPVLRPMLTTRDLLVGVEWQKRNWDLLISLETCPKRVPNGYTCAMCPSDRVFANRTEMYRDHLFEPFLKWVNEELAAARSLGIFGKYHYTTWAELLPENQNAIKENETRIALIV